MKIKRLRKVNESNEIVEAVDQSIFLPISRGGDHGYFTVYGTNRRGDVEALHINKVYARSGDSFTVSDGYDRYRVWKYTNPEDAKKDLEFAQRMWPYGPKWEIAELVKEGRYYVLKDQPAETNESLTEAAEDVSILKFSEFNDIINGNKNLDIDDQTFSDELGDILFTELKRSHPGYSEDQLEDIASNDYIYTYRKLDKSGRLKVSEFIRKHISDESGNKETGETVYAMIAGRDSKVFKTREAAEKRSKQYNYNVSMSGSNDGYSYVVETTLQ